MTPLSRWILACAALVSASVLSLDARAQMNPRGPAAGGCRQSDVPAAGSAIGDHRPRRWRRGSGQGRANPPLPGCRDQAARRARSRHLAGQAHGLRQFRVLLAVQRPVGAMRSGQQPDPADACQSGPDHDQPRAAARRRLRRRRARQSAPLGAAGAGPEQLRAAICQRRARRGQFPRQSVRQQQQQSERARRRFRSAIRHLPHRLRPDLRRRLFSDLVRHRARPLPRR